MPHLGTVNKSPAPDYLTWWNNDKPALVTFWTISVTRIWKNDMSQIWPICIYAMLYENAKYVKHRLVREPIQQVCTFPLYFFHPGSQAFTSNHGRGLVPAARYASLHLSLALELFSVHLEWLSSRKWSTNNYYWPWSLKNKTRNNLTNFIPGQAAAAHPLSCLVTKLDTVAFLLLLTFHVTKSWKLPWIFLSFYSAKIAVKGKTGWTSNRRRSHKRFNVSVISNSQTRSISIPRNVCWPFWIIGASSISASRFCSTMAWCGKRIQENKFKAGCLHRTWQSRNYPEWRQALDILRTQHQHLGYSRDWKTCKIEGKQRSLKPPWISQSNLESSFVMRDNDMDVIIPYLPAGK